MSTILISIKPEYVERIFNGTKKYEYRKYLANKCVDKMIIYCTAPVKAVVGEATIEDTISDTPEKLWEQTKDFAGISKEKYFEYFSGKEKANCYVLGDCVKYDQPKKLEDFGINVAPQAWLYVREDLTQKKDFWNIIGQYILDGYLENEEVVIACNNDCKLKKLKFYLDKCKFKYSIEYKTECRNVRIPNTTLYSFVSQFGDNFMNKHLTNTIFNLPIDYLKTFLEGFLMECFFEENNLIIFITSKELAYGIAQCVNKVYKIPCSIDFNSSLKRYSVSWSLKNVKD